MQCTQFPSLGSTVKVRVRLLEPRDASAGMGSLRIRKGDGDDGGTEDDQQHINGSGNGIND